MVAIDSVTSSGSNIVAGGSTPATNLSYYPYPGTSAAESSSTMSFDDFLDMINPLEHIPIVSSIYRAVTGETINPISRIAGDALYGGIMGLASAGLAALGAIGDEVVAANNDGKSISATVVAALFGTDETNSPDDVQLAETTAQPDATAPESSTSTAALQLAALQTPALQSPILEIPDFSSSQTTTNPDTTVQTASAQAPSQTSSDTSAPAANNGSMPLDRSKKAYGGVMDPAMMQSAQQNQALALAMSTSARTLQNQHDLRNSRFATAAGNPSIPQAQTDAHTQAALQDLIKQLQSSKATTQYQSAAQSTPATGAAVDITN